jgi:hypothetical protein
MLGFRLLEGLEICSFRNWIFLAEEESDGHNQGHEHDCANDDADQSTCA